MALTTCSRCPTTGGRFIFRGDEWLCESCARQRLPRNAAWGDDMAVVVFRKPDGSISYPARNDKPTPDGCERLVMRSLPEVRRFEREHNVACEVLNYDRNGRGLDDGAERPRRQRG